MVRKTLPTQCASPPVTVVHATFSRIVEVRGIQVAATAHNTSSDLHNTLIIVNGSTVIFQNSKAVGTILAAIHDTFGCLSTLAGTFVAIVSQTTGYRTTISSTCRQAYVSVSTRNASCCSTHWSLRSHQHTRYHQESCSK